MSVVLGRQQQLGEILYFFQRDLGDSGRTFATIAWFFPDMAADGHHRRHEGTGFLMYKASPLHGASLTEAPDNLIHVSCIKSLVHMIHDCCDEVAGVNPCSVAANGRIQHQPGRNRWLHVL